MANNQPRTKGIRGSPVVHGARSGDRGLGLLLAGLGAGLGRRADRRDRAALASDAQAAGVEREGIRQAGMDRRAAAVLEFKKGEDHKDLRAAAEKYKLEVDQLDSMLGHLEEIGVEAPGELLSRQEELHNSYGALAAKVVAGAADYASSGGPSAAGLPLDIPEDTASGLKARSKSYGDIASILDSGIKKAQTELKSSKVTGADREQAERRINEQIQKLLVLRVKQRNLEAREESVELRDKRVAFAAKTQAADEKITASRAAVGRNVSRVFKAAGIKEGLTIPAELTDMALAAAEDGATLPQAVGIAVDSSVVDGDIPVEAAPFYKTALTSDNKEERAAAYMKLVELGVAVDKAASTFARGEQEAGERDRAVERKERAEVTTAKQEKTSSDRRAKDATTLVTKAMFRKNPTTNKEVRVDISETLETLRATLKPSDAAHLYRSNPAEGVREVLRAFLDSLYAERQKKGPQ